MIHIAENGLLTLGFWRDLVVNASATLLGVAAGIPVALRIDRILAKRREAQDYRAHQDVRREQRKQLLSVLRTTLEINRALIETSIVRGDSNPDDFATGFDAALLDSTASLKYELIPDLKLNAAIDSIRTGLTHLNRLQDYRARFELSVFRGEGRYADLRKLLRQAASEQASRTRESIDEALKLLAAESKRE